MAADAGLSVLVVELEGKAGIGAGLRAPRASRLRRDDPAPAPGARPGGADGARAGVPSGGGGSPPTTPCSSTWPTTGSSGCPSVWSPRAWSTWWPRPSPGIRDVLVLGKIKQLEQDRVADLIMVDAPATGHAVTFLTSASGLLDAARSGPVRTQAADVVELLSDPTRCRVVLVTLPEEMPVSETVEAAYQLEDRAGVQLGPVVVNGWDQAPGLATDTAVGPPARPGSPSRRPSWRPSRRPGASGSTASELQADAGRAARPGAAPAPAPPSPAVGAGHRAGRTGPPGRGPGRRGVRTLIPETRCAA